MQPMSQRAKFATQPISPPGKPKDPPELLAQDGTLAAAIPASVVDAKVNRKRARWSDDLKDIAPNKNQLEEPIQNQRKVIRPTKPSSYIDRE